VEEISIGEFARRSRLSVKSLRLYDELGVLAPARVDQASGYRYYDVGQLANARLIAMLRQLEFPLPEIRELLVCDPIETADRIGKHWQRTEIAHDARRDLANYLINQLRGKETIMNEVNSREIPERSLLCLKRNVYAEGAWAFGKEFIAILKERPLPKIAGREGAFIQIFWGEVSADSDGPIEWCWPVPQKDAEALASHYPELHLRTEPAHREAFVALGDSAGGYQAAEWQLAIEALIAWKIEQGIDDEKLTIRPEDLGLRITYLASEPNDERSAPYCDLAAPFA
jgi:DNA-binding transcriptional MerR regulator